jgi:putative transposase
VIDDYNRQYLGFDLWRSLPAPSVTRALDDFIDFHGKPKRIRIDNGPEYTSHYMQLWAKEHEIELQFIQPGKPTRYSYIERSNSIYRTKVLDASLFTSMHEIRTVTEALQHKYNHYRPHGSLIEMAPIEFILQRKSLTWRPTNKGFKAVTSKGGNPKHSITNTGGDIKTGEKQKHYTFHSIDLYLQLSNPYQNEKVHENFWSPSCTYCRDNLYTV